MKGLVYTGAETLAFQDVADPAPGADDVLIRVDSVGICGSDMHAYLGHDERRPPPLILGHEGSGVIASGPREGERVTINPLNTCLACPACLSARENLCPSREILSMPPRHGAFADYVVARERNLVTVPDHVSLEIASLAEPMAVSWHAAKLGLDALHPAMERRAFVIGGGAIGVTAGLALRAMGVEDIVLMEPNPLRRAYVNSSCDLVALDSLNGSAPLVLDAVGYAKTREVASRLTEPGGVLVHIGLGEATGGLDIRRMTLQEITFIGTYCYTAQDFRDSCAAIFDGRLGSLAWTDVRSLKDGASAFEDIRHGRVAAPKIILKPS